MAETLLNAPKSGRRIPVRFNPFEILNNESAITINPTNLKNGLAKAPLIREVKPPTPSNPGAVPRAKTPIVKAPVTGLPLDIANNCIACVNPHGKKNVIPPSKNDPRLLYSFCFWVSIPTSLYNPFGSVNLTLSNLGKIPTVCKPSSNITPPTAIVSKPIDDGPNCKNEPKYPINAPNTVKKKILPKLNMTCGLNFCSDVALGCFSENLAETPKTNPPTNAIHVERPAVRPTSNTTGRLAKLFEDPKAMLKKPNPFATK
ncbi:MAG: hypothetical protein ACD_22C00127G0002 [uncultured bacterium]|nr:MAG: hypothetical protein ACD_22C00127G0002 [uncultured bacterium]